MSRHHYDDFWRGCRRRDPMVPVDYLLRGYRKPHYWAGRPRHRVIDGLTPRLSRTVRENTHRRERVAQGAAQMCVMTAAAVTRGGLFEFEMTVH